MKLTKKEAITHCRELWDWLSKHPSKRKHEWPGWELHWPVLNSCFACEYSSKEIILSDGRTHKEVVCRKCFLKKIWDGGLSHVACERNSGSSYNKWWRGKRTGDRKKTKEGALEIVAECDRLLKRYKKPRGKSKTGGRI